MNWPRTEGEIEGRIEVTGRRGRRRKELLYDAKEKRGYWKLKKETLDRTVWRNRFGRGYGPNVRQETGYIYFLSVSHFKTGRTILPVIMQFVRQRLVTFPQEVKRNGIKSTANLLFHFTKCSWFWSVARGVFRSRQTRQLPRAVDLKGRLLSCQSY